MSVRIPPPPNTPFKDLNTWLNSMYQELIRLDKENRKLTGDLEVARDIRFILHDSAGARYVVDVNPTGPVVRATPL